MILRKVFQQKNAICCHTVILAVSDIHSGGLFPVRVMVTADSGYIARYTSRGTMHHAPMDSVLHLVQISGKLCNISCPSGYIWRKACFRHALVPGPANTDRSLHSHGYASGTGNQSSAHVKAGMAGRGMWIPGLRCDRSTLYSME